MFRANLWNEKTGTMEEVTVCGYFRPTSNDISTDYAEIYKNDGYYYSARFANLYPSINTGKDILAMMKDATEMYEIMNKIVNKGE